ncbi:hypothetical protein BVC93_10460 [Mycobacterium sp. MS1601]|uniref:hypothetical protein n=1 Tax=Mycobacterium sp. MS1601 TaxID=1936029 RepID=UPI0009791153|nr:hypothetical protein [Mycobacterium sp. MS1601]AQA02783.1 hypothetical protein BVC93_10460 [Mycobacterium sp. MS1601]
MKWLGGGLLAAALLSGCGAVSGVPLPAADDPTVFFDGPAASFGQRVSSPDRIRLTYLRALRRIDVCGLVDRAALSRVGEIQSLGSLFALNQCDVEVKVPGRAAPSYISAALELTTPHGPEILTVESLPVSEAYDGACEYLIPVNLADLPGASPLFGPEQPHLRVSMVAESDCATVRRVASVIAERVAGGSLPVRDGAAAYTTALAERDPCEILAALPAGDIGYWNVPGTGPYRCEFGIDSGPDGGTVPMVLSLRPRLVDAAVEGREHTGADVYLDRRSCSALVFVGPDLQRRLGNGALADTGDISIRPTVEVSGKQAPCTGNTLAEQVAVRAAGLFR